MKQKQKCGEENCLNNPIFNFDSETKGIQCGQHKKQNMVDVRTKRRCVEENCLKQLNIVKCRYCILQNKNHLKSGMKLYENITQDNPKESEDLDKQASINPNIMRSYDLKNQDLDKTDTIETTSESQTITQVSPLKFSLLLFVIFVLSMLYQFLQTINNKYIHDIFGAIYFTLIVAVSQFPSYGLGLVFMAQAYKKWVISSFASGIFGLLWFIFLYDEAATYLYLILIWMFLEIIVMSFIAQIMKSKQINNKIIWNTLVASIMLLILGAIPSVLFISQSFLFDIVSLMILLQIFQLQLQSLGIVMICYIDDQIKIPYSQLSIAMVFWIFYSNTLDSMSLAVLSPNSETLIQIQIFCVLKQTIISTPIGFKIIDNILFNVFGKPKKQNDHQRKIILTTELFVNAGTVFADIIFLCCGFIPIGGILGQYTIDRIYMVIILLSDFLIVIAEYIVVKQFKLDQWQYGQEEIINIAMNTAKGYNITKIIYLYVNIFWPIITAAHLLKGVMIAKLNIFDKSE